MMTSTGDTGEHAKREASGSAMLVIGNTSSWPPKRHRDAISLIEVRRSPLVKLIDGCQDTRVVTS